MKTFSGKGLFGERLRREARVRLRVGVGVRLRLRLRCEGGVRVCKPVAVGTPLGLGKHDELAPGWGGGLRVRVRVRVGVLR